MTEILNTARKELEHESWSKQTYAEYYQLNHSLITTIESQKEEIERLTGRMFQHRKALGYVVFFQVEDDPDIKNVAAEGYKAITELAVKELKNELSFAIMFDHRAAIVRLQESISEIERGMDAKT
jgi:ribosomal protein S18 acetylase RimI-like enzyme